MPQPFPDAPADFPRVTATDMRHLDQWVVREFQRPLIVTLELAGLRLAEFVQARYDPPPGASIVAAVGRGAKGAAVLAAARHLLARGHPVRAVATEVHTKFKDEPMRMLAQFRKEGGSAPPFTADRSLGEAALFLDGLVGYGLTENVKGPVGQMIDLLNGHEAPTVALDLPSGLDPETGAPGDLAVEAEATLAVATVKQCCLETKARRSVGELYLADVGFPLPLYRELKADPVELFRAGPIVRVPTGASRRRSG